MTPFEGGGSTYYRVMAVLYSEAPEGALLAEPLPHKTWTRNELALIEATGVLEGTHYELIEGELIDKMGKGYPHSMGVLAMVNALKAIFGMENAIQEVAINVAAEDNPRNEPEPDVSVLQQNAFAVGENPGPADIVLLVEVADSSLSQDLSTKAKLYARAGIPEYWVLDLNGRRMFVHRDPVEGRYGTRFEVDAKGAVEPLSKPGHAISLADILRKVS